MKKNYLPPGFELIRLTYLNLLLEASLSDTEIGSFEGIDDAGKLTESDGF